LVDNRAKMTLKAYTKLTRLPGMAFSCVHDLLFKFLLSMDKGWNARDRIYPLSKAGVPLRDHHRRTWIWFIGMDERWSVLTGLLLSL